MNKAASVYGKVLFDLALEAAIVEAVASDLDTLVKEINSNSRAQEILYHSKLPKTDKKNIFKKIAAGAPELLIHFLMLLIDKNRIEMLEEIASVYRLAVNNHLSILEGSVTSASVLEQSQLVKLNQLFSQKLGKKVCLSPKVDLSLIGGYRVSIAGQIYDNSIKLQLKEMTKELMNVNL